MQCKFSWCIFAYTFLKCIQNKYQKHISARKVCSLTCPGSVRRWQCSSLVRPVQSQDAVDGERGRSVHLDVLMSTDCERRHPEIWVLFFSDWTSTAVIPKLEVHLYTSSLIVPETSPIKAWDGVFYMWIAGPHRGTPGRLQVIQGLNPLSSGDTESLKAAIERDKTRLMCLSFYSPGRKLGPVPRIYLLLISFRCISSIMRKQSTSA